MCNNNGWIKLHRAITLWEFFGCHDMLTLWVYLLSEAAYNDGFGGISAGQLRTSYGQLSKATNIPRRRVRYLLEKLSIKGYIKISNDKSTNVIAHPFAHPFAHLDTLITICNYDSYSDSTNVNCTPSCTPFCTLDKEKEEKKKEKEKERSKEKEISKENKEEKESHTLRYGERNEKIKKESNACVCVRESAQSRVDVYSEELLSDATFIEATVMRFKFSRAEIARLISDFSLELAAKAISHTTYTEYRRHAFEWLRKQKNGQIRHNTKQYGSNTDEARAERQREYAAVAEEFLRAAERDITLRREA